MVTVIKKGSKKIEKRINAILSKNPSNDLMKYAGILKTDINPSTYQKMMRDEWK